jgi:flagellar motor switch/type III secretory pathway protein FliN
MSAAPASAPTVAAKSAANSSSNRSVTDPETQRWQPVMNLPCQLTVDLGVPAFRVSDFLQLRPGSVIGTQWRVTHDLPLRVNGTLIAWAELEGAGNHLAVRLTELA